MMPALLCAGAFVAGTTGWTDMEPEPVLNPAFVAGTTGWTDMEPEPEPDQDFC